MGWSVVERKQARVVQLVRLIRERKREKLAKVATDLNYSYHYFRYSLLPEILARVECVEYDKARDELVWVCDGDQVRELARREAREFLDRLEQARPEG